MSNLPQKDQKVKALIKLMENDAVSNRFKELQKEKAAQYTTSIVNTVKASDKLLDCDRNQLLGEVFKAAALDLMIEPALGHACIIPFKTKGKYVANFIIQIRGWIQLAQRSGQIVTLNVASVYEDEIERYDPIFEEVVFKKPYPENPMRDDPKKDPVGYVAKVLLKSGFKKMIYWTRSRVMKHAIQYVPSWDKQNKCFYKNSFWDTNFNEQAQKTVLKQLISRWCPVSTDLAKALSDDETLPPIDDQRTPEPTPTPEPKKEAPKAKPKPKAPKPQDADVIDNDDDDPFGDD